MQHGKTGYHRDCPDLGTPDVIDVEPVHAPANGGPGGDAQVARHYVLTCPPPITWVMLEAALLTCAFQPSRTPDPMMPDTLGASRRKQVSYLSDCPPWGKAEAVFLIDSRVESSMRWAL